MGTSVLVSEREYPTTSYDPDCEYEDGNRIPDVFVYKEPGPHEPMPGTPPFIVIEIPSAEERMSRVRKKIDDYLAFGVSYVWPIDPQRRRADAYTASAIYEAKDGVLRTDDPAIEVPLAELFQALDD